MSFWVSLDNLFISSDSDCLLDSNVYIITVPTPVTKANQPDLSYLESASKIVGKYLKKDDIVIYESTVYPGVTEDICVSILENQSNLTYNTHFFCGYSPERISPGDSSKSLENIVKVTSGSNIKTAKNAREHLNNNGVLIIFPSGGVSIAKSLKSEAVDDAWKLFAI